MKEWLIGILLAVWGVVMLIIVLLWKFIILPFTAARDIVLSTMLIFSNSPDVPRLSCLGVILLNIFYMFVWLLIVEAIF